MTTITWTEFESKYQPIETPYRDWDWSDFPDALNTAIKEHPEHVWTIISSDEGDKTLVISNVQTINSLGYIITNQPLDEELVVCEMPDRGVLTDMYGNELEEDENGEPICDKDGEFVIKKHYEDIIKENKNG